VRDPQLAAQVAQIALSSELPPQAAQLHIRLVFGLARYQPRNWPGPRSAINVDTFVGAVSQLRAADRWRSTCRMGSGTACRWTSSRAWVRAHVPAEMAVNVDRGMETARNKLSEKRAIVPAADAYVRSAGT
jgi:hypothetical protein